MPFNSLKAGLTIGNEQFDTVFPESLRVFSDFHYTPVEVALKAAAFLAEKPATRILDIGSGAGKFCLIGAAVSSAHFTGVEQRGALNDVAASIAKQYCLGNTRFIHANITEIQFTGFDAFYLFNPFWENIVQSEPVDTSIRLNKSLYYAYTGFVKNQLDAMPSGTRLATFFSYGFEIPDSYNHLFSAFDGKLKLWVRS